ncbi:hypothetical protein FRB94_000705 [Tulasnella sp. JGI-2019a]|nr:hypothetical protein FRB94_000705 [Tulasnella sp. JGI-2019a]
MVDLAVEIWLRIINALGRPGYPSAYRLDPGCSAALAALCRVNHTFQQAAEPVLYSVVFISPGNLAAVTRAVTIHDNDKNDVYPTKRGSCVKALAIATFEDVLTNTQLQRTRRILDGLRPFIARILLGVNVRAGLFDNVQRLDNLEELCAFGHFPVSPDGSQWPKLKRLCFVPDRSRVILPILSQIPSVDTCVYLELRDGYACGDLIDHCMHTPGSQVITVVIPIAQSESFSEGMMMMWGCLRLHGDQKAREAMERCQLVATPDAPPNSRHPTTQEIACFANEVINGRIWDMKGRPLP